ncbi:MAG: 3-isopropylmalate dehydrogenase [Bacteroidota bacterium]
MKKNITVIEGDGIGPEVVAQAIKVLDAVAKRYQHEFTYAHHLMGAVAIDQTGSALPEETIKSAQETDAVLLGAVGDPRFDNDPTAKVRPEQGLLQIRKVLQLYANIRPVKVYDALKHLAPLKADALENVDFVIFRELTGGIYFGEKQVDEAYTQASDTCSYNRQEVERIAHLAFKQALIRGKKLTLVDKANVLETSRLWRKVVQELADEYPEVELHYLFVDNAAMQLILNPGQFDVMLTGNMFGDILSDEASVLSGSLGMMPSASIGVGTALFEPVHGSYPQGAGKDIANPMATILSVAMMLDYFEMNEEAEMVRKAVQWAIDKAFVTQDINAKNFHGTSAVGDFIAAFVGNKLEELNHSAAV